jgi:hypothetical protein
MNEKRFAGLTVEQLNAAGAAAGADAVSRAHAAGLPSPGMTKLRLESGKELKVLTRLHPDGTLEIVDERIAIRAQTASEALDQIMANTDNRDLVNIKSSGRGMTESQAVELSAAISKAERSIKSMITSKAKSG